MKSHVRNKHQNPDAVHSTSLPPLPAMDDDDDDDLSHLLPKTLTLVCTIGGVLVPRGGTGKFRCVNGETRLVSLDRSRPITLSTLWSKIVSVYCHSKKHDPLPSSLRYVHPSAPPNLMDDRPSLVSLASDADVMRMVKEHDRARARRVRIFVVDDDGRDKGLVEERVFGRSWDVNVAVSPPQDGLWRGGGDFVGVGNCSPGVRARSSGRGVVQDRILQPGVEKSLAYQEGNQLPFVNRVVNDVVPFQTSYVPSPDHYQLLLDSQNSNGRPCLSHSLSSAMADAAHPSLHSLSGATGYEVERVGPGAWSVCMNIASEIDWTNETDFKCGDSVVSGRDGLTVDVYGIGAVIGVSSAVNTLCSSLNGNDVALPVFITRSGTSTLPTDMQLCLNHEGRIMNFCRSSSFVTMRSAKSMSRDPANFTADNSMERAAGTQFLQKDLPPPSSLLMKLSIDAGRTVTDGNENQNDAHSSSKREEKPKIEKPKPTCSIMLPEIGSNLSSSYPQLAVRELQTINNSDLEEIRELGSGANGTVFYGKWRGSDVAIKRLKPGCFPGSNLEEDRMVSDLWKEAYLMAQLHHPNVVAFYGIATDEEATNLATVTEYMVNGSLKQVMQRKDRTIDRRKRLIIAMDAAFGMEYLHVKNIVHFDLKSHNFLVNMKDPHRPVCKIGDLGLSKVKGRTLVSAGVRGTIPWMAPELLTNSMVTEKVDVYSFGIVMWELLTGEEPYENMHSEEMIAGIVKGSLRPTIPCWCDPEWKSLMERCWLSDATLRPSFSEIASELCVIAAAMNIR